LFFLVSLFLFFSDFLSPADKLESRLQMNADKKKKNAHSVPHEQLRALMRQGFFSFFSRNFLLMLYVFLFFSMPCDPISHLYKDGLDGDRLKYFDEIRQYRQESRYRYLYGMQNRNALNPVTGARLPALDRPAPVAPKQSDRLLRASFVAFERGEQLPAARGDRRGVAALWQDPETAHSSGAYPSGIKPLDSRVSDYLPLARHRKSFKPPPSEAAELIHPL
jgi:hypothetical protein